MKWVPENRFMELTLNGEYQGLYQMTPHIEAAPFKADLGDGEGIKFLAEIDARLDGDYPKTTNYGTSLIIKSKAKSIEAKNIYQFIDEMESAVYENRAPWDFIDRKSLVHTYLVNELTRNNDSFWSSTFFYKPVNKLVIFGPVWDFDISLGNIDYNNNWLTEGFWVSDKGYVAAAFKNSEFQREVNTEWKRLEKMMPSLVAYIDLQSEKFQDAQKRNFAKWDILKIYVWPNQKVTGSYALEVEYLKEWLLARAKWLEGQYGEGKIN
jgi:spore coat protein CotH